MNNQFSNSRSPLHGGGMPFYNPQKDAINPNNPNLYQPNNNNPSSYIPNTNSKSFISRSNIMQPIKPANNTSAFIKNSNEGLPPSNKLTSNHIISPSSGFTAANYQTYTHGFQNKTTNNEMAKSLIHDSHKNGFENNLGYPIVPPEKPAFLANTPTRRAPRMSQPLQMDYNPPVTKPFEFKSNTTEQLTESPGLQKRFKDPKQFQNNFLKNKQIGSSPLIEQQKDEKSTRFEGSTGKSQIWSKGSLGKKRPPLSVKDFIKIKQLGSGKYGQVSLVKQKSSGFICALKMIQKKLLKEQEITDQFIRELKIQLFLNHPNIIKMYGYFDDQAYIYIILEVCTGGQLYHQLRKSEPMPENKVATIMRQVCEAVKEIHGLRIIHRDIKPQNIVLHENVIKLCDFGWSVYLDNKLRTTFCGTPLYVCPQILKGRQYDQKIDIWSLGIMMYQMIVGENPFKITKEEELIKIVKQQICIPSYVYVSRQARDFLDKCLKKNPADRVTIKELLNHQFFNKNPDKNQKKLAF